MTSSELTCREVVEIVNDYLDGGLSPARRRRFEEHLAECGACVTYVEQMRLTIGAVERLDAEQVEPAVLAELVRAFRGWPSA